jgi:hypothetical protein
MHGASWLSKLKQSGHSFCAAIDKHDRQQNHIKVQR